MPCREWSDVESGSDCGQDDGSSYGRTPAPTSHIPRYPSTTMFKRCPLWLRLDCCVHECSNDMWFTAYICICCSCFHGFVTIPPPNSSQWLQAAICQVAALFTMLGVLLLLCECWVLVGHALPCTPGQKGLRSSRVLLQLPLCLLSYQLASYHLRTAHNSLQQRCSCTCTLSQRHQAPGKPQTQS